MKVRVHVFISGKVQGVFFRSETRYQANRWKITGWTQNLSDGRVEAVFEGEKENIEKLLNFCKKGPLRAEVTNIDITWENYTGKFNAFKIL